MAQFNDVKIYKELNLCDHSSNMFTHGNGRKNVLSYSGTTMKYGDYSDIMDLRGQSIIQSYGNIGYLGITLGDHMDNKICNIFGNREHDTYVYGNDIHVNSHGKATIDGDTVYLSANKLTLCNILYGTSDPPSDSGVEGQIYFKII